MKEIDSFGVDWDYLDYLDVKVVKTSEDNFFLNIIDLVVRYAAALIMSVVERFADKS
jgi:hypothetical protein